MGLTRRLIVVCPPMPAAHLHRVRFNVWTLGLAHCGIHELVAATHRTAFDLIERSSLWSGRAAPSQADRSVAYRSSATLACFQPAPQGRSFL
jgi:hypothetical protein